MPTTKKRLYVTLPQHVAVFIQKIALRDEVSQSQKAVELIEEALAFAEDEYFSKLAEKRIQEGGKYLTHKQVWG